MKKILSSDLPRPRRRLRELLNGSSPLVAPGAYDALSAKLVEQGGFQAVYMSGSGVSASMGFPDYGLLSLSEMAERAGLMARSITVPLIADADTGYGNELNVTRTIREYEARGVAALHIEDQVSPKRCGHLEGKEVISRSEFISKIRAAVDARIDPEFVLIARTDSRLTHGLDEAVERGRLALEAGADLIFIEAAQSEEELAAIPPALGGSCMLNLVPGGQTPLITAKTAGQMGYRLVIYPSVSLAATVTAISNALTDLRATGAVKQPSHDVVDLKERFRLMGAEQWDEIRKRHRSEP